MFLKTLSERDCYPQVQLFIAAKSKLRSYRLFCDYHNIPASDMNNADSDVIDRL